MTICIIPARSGSKRIKNKNIKLFDGKPIISYAIQLAKSCGLFKRIIVSTDSYSISTLWPLSVAVAAIVARPKVGQIGLTIEALVPP